MAKSYEEAAANFLAFLSFFFSRMAFFCAFRLSLALSIFFSDLTTFTISVFFADEEGEEEEEDSAIFDFGRFLFPPLDVAPVVSVDGDADVVSAVEEETGATDVVVVVSVVVVFVASPSKDFFFFLTLGFSSPTLESAVDFLFVLRSFLFEAS